jgi:hypothetical protein
MSFSLNGFGLSYDGENWTIDKLPEDDPLCEPVCAKAMCSQHSMAEPFDIAKIVETLAQADANATVKITVTRDGGAETSTCRYRTERPHWQYPVRRRNRARHPV